MSEGPQDRRNHNVYHDPIKEIPSQDFFSVVVGDIAAYVLQPQRMEMLQAVSPTLEAGPSQNRVPPINLERVENNVNKISGNEKSTFSAPNPLMSLIELCHEAICSGPALRPGAA